MAWVRYQPNPAGNATALDCTVRALCCVTGYDWDTVYDELSRRGKIVKNAFVDVQVWGGWLHDLGFVRHAAPNPCLSCCTVACFAADHPRGTYLVCPHEHITAVIDGDWWDSWDSGNQRVLFYWSQRS